MLQTVKTYVIIHDVLFTGVTNGNKQAFCKYQQFLRYLFGIGVSVIV